MVPCCRCAISSREPCASGRAFLLSSLWLPAWALRLLPRLGPAKSSRPRVVRPRTICTHGTALATPIAPDFLRSPLADPGELLTSDGTSFSCVDPHAPPSTCPSGQTLVNGSCTTPTPSCPSGQSADSNGTCCAASSMVNGLCSPPPAPSGGGTQCDPATVPLPQGHGSLQFSNQGGGGNGYFQYCAEYYQTCTLPYAGTATGTFRSSLGQSTVANVYGPGTAPDGTAIPFTCAYDSCGGLVGTEGGTVSLYSSQMGAMEQYNWNCPYTWATGE